MKAFRFTHLRPLLAGVIALGSAWAAATPQPAEPEKPAPTRVVYEVALINKSMTGDWRDERAFRKQVQELFGTSKILKFKLRGDPLQDWLDSDTPSVAKVICLIDGWTSPGMTRVDVRGSRDGQPLKLTVEVERGDWKEALAQAKRHVEPPG